MALGHQAGDEALRVVVGLIKQEVWPIDQVARYGGEEFATILPETSSFDALAIAEQLHQAIATHEIMIAQGQAIHVTVSSGVATFPEDAGSEAVLTFTADQSLYATKHSSRNRIVGSNRSVGLIASVLGH
jgi:diguanylate cyclase (GGDEF)-like protein